MKIFGGDEDLPLQGGSVAVLLDRKAAAFIYKRRLHTVSLLVTRAEGLAWPAATEQVGRVRANVQTVRGFTTITWVDGELGYAAVSDVERTDMLRVAAKLAQ
jgi:anti-sigma factor RsiW